MRNGFKCYGTQMENGKLIVLNGTSSSGKTSIARALQAIWPTPLLYLALDTAMGLLPFDYTGDGCHSKDGYRLHATVQSGDPVISYSLGRHANFLNNALASFAASLCSASYDVVLDHVIADDATMVGLAERVDGRTSFLIGVYCDGDVASARERVRGNRLIGLAASQALTVHSGIRPYDFTVDSSRTRAEELAEAISQFINGSTPTGLGWVISDR